MVAGKSAATVSLSSRPRCLDLDLLIFFLNLLFGFKIATGEVYCTAAAAPRRGGGRTEQKRRQPRRRRCGGERRKRGAPAHPHFDVPVLV